LALACLADQELAGPGGDAGRVEPGTDDEQRGDENHRWIAEPGERLTEVQHSRRPKRERRGQCDHDHRESIPDEQDHDRRDDREGQRDVAQDADPRMHLIARRTR